ncbi:Flagellar motor switch protein [Treponema sp. JC4]|uniref:FliG C-terminal domain-containing protein n=1 Tax=Treponema sp. JC4 TaxID=1124982 RepID=UPI00025B0CD0|nr:FliG C-terminal domain-containing protein [Treponema sp. JC4]EID84132.1 Flagellar motor switch protein [Treponema sp. JC4]
MTDDLSVESRKAQIMVSYAMDNITKETQKVLREYLQHKHLESLAKVIAYLELDSTEADELLQMYDYDTRDKIFECSKQFQKTDDSVIAEADHVVKSAFINCEEDYQIIKENLPATGRDFSEKAVHDFRAKTPVLKEKLDKCVFNIEDIVYLKDRDIQKILRDVDREKIAIILKFESDEIRNKIFRNLSERAAKMLQEEIDLLGPIPQSQLNNARSYFVNTIFRLEIDEGMDIFSRDSFWNF